jgi:hypothetical protein
MSVVSNTVADRFALELRSLTRALPAIYYGTRIAAAVSIALYAAFLLRSPARLPPFCLSSCFRNRAPGFF